MPQKGEHAAAGETVQTRQKPFPVVLDDCKNYVTPTSNATSTRRCAMRLGWLYRRRPFTPRCESSTGSGDRLTSEFGRFAAKSRESE